MCSGLHEDSVMRIIDADALKKGWVTLRVLKDDVFTGDLFFLNIGSGEKVRIAKPDEDAVLLTAHQHMKSATVSTTKAASSPPTAA